MGMLTKPKLILPFQIARAIQKIISHADRDLRGSHSKSTAGENRYVWFHFAKLLECARVLASLLTICCAEDSARYAGLEGNTQGVVFSTYAASSSSCREMPRNSKRRINVSSIKLFGQDAPAVMPMTAGPFGNQKCETISRFSCKS